MTIDFSKIKTYSYNQYRILIDELLNQNKTTGKNHTQGYLDYTKLNVQRMNRVDKTLSISPEFQHKFSSGPNAIWLLFSEAWCGDCGQIVPVIAKAAEASNHKIDLRIVIADEYPELFEHFLTNGARSVPKLVVVNPTTFESGKSWGARPQSAHAIMLNWKANQETISKEQFQKDLHLWYAQNKGFETLQELTALL